MYRVVYVRYFSLEITGGREIGRQLPESNFKPFLNMAEILAFFPVIGDFKLKTQAIH